MSAHKFSGSVPEIYHRYLVPLIFEAYAEDLSERVGVNAGDTVLETAMGTGVLTERLIAKLPSQVQLIATDFSPAMLEVAQSNLPAADNVLYKEANGVDLPFADSSFDALVCQFGVMFFPDVQQGYREAYRVLKSGGEFIFNVWDKIDYNEIPRIVHEVALSLDKHNPPDFLKTPWSYNDVDTIVEQLKSAGFSDVTVTVLQRESTAPSARDVALALGAGSPLAMQLEERGLSEVAIDRFTEALEERFGSGQVSAPMQAIVFQAR
jgi:ubiquinone/menaquinone biosynthesis C-methylase UbiE